MRRNTHPSATAEHTDHNRPDKKNALLFPPGRETLINIYRYYGFKECNDIYHFLEYICDPIPGRAELNFIAERTRECLKRHDDGSEYFTELRAALLFLTTASEKWSRREK